MPNAYYTFTDTFIPGAKGRSGDIDREYQAVEVGFDNLPTGVDSITRGVSTFAPETGSGNAYVVTMPDTRTSNQDGDEVTFFASHGNTGNVTLNIDGIGAVSMRDRAGVQIAAAGITSGRLYIATYDATNTFFVLDAAINVVTNILDVVQGSGVDDPTAPGTFDADLEYQNSTGAVLANVGYNGDTDYSIINRVHGGSVIVQAEDAGGTVRTILSADPDALTTLRADTNLELQVAAGETALLATANAQTALYFNDIRKFATSSIGAIVHADIVTATPPIAEAVQNSIRLFDLDESDELARIGFSGNNQLDIRNRMHGGAVSIQAEDAAGVLRTILSADPDNLTTLRADTNLELQVNTGSTALLATATGQVALYFNGIERFRTSSAGNVTLRSETSTDAESRVILFAHQDGVARGVVGHENAAFVMRNQIHGGTVLISAEDVGTGAVRTILSGDPDGSTILRGDTDVELQNAAGTSVLLGTGGGTTVIGAVTNLELQVAAGETALLATANAGVDTYHNNIKRFSTLASGVVAIQSDTSTDTEERRLMFEHQDGTDRGYVGYDTDDVLNIANLIHGGSVILSAEDAGGTPRIFLSADPDTTTILRGDTDLELQVAVSETALLANANSSLDTYFNNVAVARTKTAATGGLEANNTQTGSGFERVLTTADVFDLKYKDANDSATNDITLSDDSDLSGWILDSDSVYSLEAVLVFFSASATPGVKWDFQISQTVQTSIYGYHVITSGAALSGDAVTLTDTVTHAIGASENLIVVISGHIVTHATLSSTLDFRFAQNVSNGTPTNHGQGAWMRVKKLGVAN